MENGDAPREDRWSEALAVGSLAFVERVKNDLGVKAAHRDGHWRHSKFVGLREDKDPKAVIREALDRATSAAL